MKKKEGYTKRMERKLLAWKARFEAERSAAEKAGSKVDADVRDRLEAAKVAGDAAFVKLRELVAAATRYVQLREELDTAWKAIAGPDDDVEVGVESREPPPRSRASAG